jgi:transcriptional regulator with XRE-family HTH domain
MAEERIGTKLRAIRSERQLSLRDVAQRSQQLAQQWGRRDCRISHSWLARVEREQHELTGPKVAVLAAIYDLRFEDLLPCSLGAAKNGHALGVAFRSDSETATVRELANRSNGSGRNTPARPRDPALPQARLHALARAAPASRR